MSDVHLDLLDWNLHHHHQEEDTSNTIDDDDGAAHVIVNHDAEHSPATLNDASDSDSNVVQSSKSMFTILSTPIKKG